MSSMCLYDLILGWVIMVGLSQDLLGLSCNILWYTRADKLGLTGYIVLGLVESSRGGS